MSLTKVESQSDEHADRRSQALQTWRWLRRWSDTRIDAGMVTEEDGRWLENWLQQWGHLHPPSPIRWLWRVLPTQLPPNVPRMIRITHAVEWRSVDRQWQRWYDACGHKEEAASCGGCGRKGQPGCCRAIPEGVVSIVCVGAMVCAALV